MDAKTLAFVALLTLGGCSSLTKGPEAPSCGGTEKPLNPELWNQRQNDIEPGRGRGR